MTASAHGDRVADAFAAVRRERFLPRGQARFASLDQPLPIGYGQTNSQPTTVRNLLDLLDVREGDVVLDVGCGSGWTTALLARLVGPGGRVVGVEIVPELVAFGRANLATEEVPWARIEQASPEVLGLPDEAPFDRVLVSAEAHDVPGALVRQLRVGGRMVVPVRGRLAVVRRTGDSPDAEPDVELVGHYAFVPLREPADPSTGRDADAQ